MRKSTHYNLNLVEGSDKVNPLVQDVPNYESIDMELYKNASAGVQLATELKSGTVHALTRTNPNAPMFRFVATSEYTLGDTFTVDGVQVTALLSNGKPLTSGCYVVNANVLCCLVGTQLTMFVPSGITKADDSEKLGGQLPSYYAKTEAVNDAITTAQNANLIALNNQKSISILNTNLNGLSFVVMTQAEYDNLANKGELTVYFIRG